jgi:hypothetical protein
MAIGFPWILSSEYRLFNGLHGIFARVFFSAPFPRAESRRNGDAAIEVMRIGRIIHAPSLAEFLTFVKPLLSGGNLRPDNLAIQSRQISCRAIRTMLPTGWPDWLW